MSPLTKCETIVPNPEINEIRFVTLILMYMPICGTTNGIDRSRNAWAMSAWKRRTSFAPTQGLHISGYVPRKHRYCNSHISSYEWKIWIITARQLRVYVTLLFPYFAHPYFINTMETQIGQHISQATEMQTCVGAKLVLRFQALITHTFIDRSILFLYRESACTSGSISRKRISLISRFGTIVSYLVRGDIFVLILCLLCRSEGSLPNDILLVTNIYKLCKLWQYYLADEAWCIPVSYLICQHK